MKSLLIKTNLVLLCLTTLLSCDDDTDTIQGSGPITTRVLELPAIRGLDISSAISVTITQGAVQEVVVEGQENLIDILSTRVDAGVWDVSFTQNTEREDDFRVFITLVDLNVLRLSGASRAVSETDLTLDGLATEASGASNISLRGTVAQQTLDVSGASQVRNFGLASRETTVEASGASGVEVTVAEQLDATASGASNIRYRGNPSTVNRDVSGASKITPD